MKTAFATRGLGKRVRQLRTERGLSQAELAAPNYTAAYLSHIEHGKRTPSDGALAHIAERLGVTVDYLATGRDPNFDLRLRLDVDQAIAEIHSGDMEKAQLRLQEVRRQAHKEEFVATTALAEEGLGSIARRRGDWDQALGHFERATDLMAAYPPEKPAPRW